MQLPRRYRSVAPLSFGFLLVVAFIGYLQFIGDEAIIIAYLASYAFVVFFVMASLVLLARLAVWYTHRTADRP